MSGSTKRFFNLDDPVVPMQHPRALVEVANQYGVERDELLLGTGIRHEMLSSPDARISYRQFDALTANAIRLTGNPAIGIDFGRQLHMANLGMLGVLVMSCPDLRTAAKLVLKYYKTMVPAWDLSIREQDEVGVMNAREAFPLGRHLVFAIESLLNGFYSIVCFLIGRELPLIEVKLPYPRPEYAEKYFDLYSVPMQFDCPEVEVRFEAHILDKKLAFSDPVTLRIAERQCARELSTMVSIEGPVVAVNRILRAIPGNYPDITSIARQLQTSERSLRRNLTAMGCSYWELLEHARKDHAIEYLLSSHMSIDEIAGRLSFADARSFRRAFKRWTGRTPAEYRKAGGT